MIPCVVFSVYVYLCFCVGVTGGWLSVFLCAGVCVHVLWTEGTDNVAAWKEEAAWEMISTALIIRGIS